MPTARLAVPARRGTLFVLGMLSSFGPVSIDVYLPALPALAEDLDASTASAQLTLTACLIGLAVGQVVVGPLSDGTGRRRPLLVALATFAVTSALCAVAPSVEALIALRLVEGVAGGASIVIARATVRDLYEGDAAARAYATLILVMGVAPVAAPVVGGQLLRVTDWRGVFGVLAGFGMLALLVAAWRVEETRAPLDRSAGAAVRDSLRTYRRLLGDPGVLLPAATLGACAAALSGYIAGSSFALQEQYGLSAQAFSLAFGGVGLGILVVGEANRRLVGRIRPVTLLRTGAVQLFAGGVFLVVAVAAGWSLGVVILALLVAISSIGLVFPNATTLAMADHPDDAGSAGALLGLLQFLMGGLAAPLVGLGGEDTASSMALVVAAAGLAATLITQVTRATRMG